MAKPVFTPAQRNAIEGRGGALYVSAAAGSGKTAVLVERVVERIINGGSIERLLVVTFTVAAASEMRQRIFAALQQRLAGEPGNRHLQRQQVLVQNARICTIDAYCSDLVRSNFHKLGIPSDFGVAVGAEYELMREAALAEVLEEAYSEQNEDFAAMAENFGGVKDDAALFQSLLRLQESLSANPDPQGWRARTLRVFGDNSECRQAVFGTVKEHAREYFTGLAGCFERVCGELETCADEKLAGAVLPLMGEDLELLAHIGEALAAPGFNAAHAVFSGAVFSSFPSLRGYTENPLKLRAHALHNELKKQALSMADGVFSMDERDVHEDAARLYPMVRTLFGVEEAFENRLRERLLRRGLLSFPEISRLALSLLAEDCDGQTGAMTPTELARTLSSELDEVIIDEYQDTNLLQNMIFYALSGNGKNLFCVGDNKQSIYRFRQAMPEIFQAKKQSAKPFGQGFPALVHLSHNFRSRPGILSFINFIFGQTMSKRLGEMDYTPDERLSCGAQYPPAKEPEVELHILRLEDKAEEDDLPDGQINEDDQQPEALLAAESSARYTALTLRRLIDSGHMVYDRGAGAMRPCRPSDCAVLLRSASVNGEIFRRELEKAGLPAYCDSFAGFFESYEISMMLEVLSAIDNPHRDIPLAAALRSPVFGFSAEMLARLRVGAKGESLFESLRRAAQTDDTCACALGRLEGYRLYARNMPAHRLVWHVYTDSGLMALAAGLSRGPERQHNLRQLYRHAASFETSSAQGLSGFIRFIRRILEQGHTLDGTRPAPAGEAVRVMTIHKSKGLEFPVVVVACCEKQFNIEDFRQPLYVHGRFGVGPSLRDTERRLEYTTLFREAIRIQMHRELLSEELRVLYVAMTRARERLILIAADKDLDGHVAKLCDRLADNPVLDPRFAESQRSYYDWILACALRHPDAGVLRSLVKSPCPVLEEGGRLLIRIADAPSAVAGSDAPAPAPEEPDTPAVPSAQLQSALRERLEFCYPRAALARVPAKVSVSELKGGRMPEEDAEPLFKGAEHYTVPRFMQERGLNAAERGEAMHKFMQFSDFALCEQGQVEEEIERLVRCAYLFEEEAASLDRGRIAAFFKGELYGRMKRSPRLVREYRFQAELLAGMVEPSLAGDALCGGERVLLQGVTDCFFEEDGKLVLVDYKTDHIRGDGSVLIGRYTGQLRLYARALEAIFGLDVKELLLYSFDLGRTLTISDG